MRKVSGGDVSEGKPGFQLHLESAISRAQSLF